MLLDGRARWLHFDLALEKCPFADADTRCEDIAFDLGGGTNIDRFGSVEIPFDLAIDDDDPRADIALHRAIRAYGETLSMGNRAFDASLNNQVLLR